MSFFVNIAFEAIINPSTYRRLLGSLVLRVASEFSPTLVTKDTLTVLEMGEVTREMVEAKPPRTFTMAHRASSQSRATARKSREPPSPTIGWCVRRSALPSPCVWGSFKFNYASSDGCLYSPCSDLFYYKYLQSGFDRRLLAYTFLRQ